MRAVHARFPRKANARTMADTVGDPTRDLAGHFEASDLPWSTVMQCTWDIDERTLCAWHVIGMNIGGRPAVSPPDELVDPSAVFARLFYAVSLAN